VSIEEVHGSPSKRRVTVSGRVLQIYTVAESETWRRRNIEIGNGTKTVTCKLWNKKVDITNIQVGDEVEISNVRVQEYAGKKSVSSSDE